MAKKKKAKKGKKAGSKGKGGKSSAGVDVPAAHAAFISRFKARYTSIGGGVDGPDLSSLVKAVTGPPSDNCDDPGWYDAQTHLQLIDIPLSPVGARAICWAILGTGTGGSGVQLPPLISKNGLSSKKSKAPIAIDQPKSYTHFSSISMIGCNTKDAGALALAELLRVGPTFGVKIAKLDVINCGISTTGAECIGQALAYGGNVTLLHLNLSYNKGLGNSGLQDLCIGLRGNSTLQSLNLHCCALNGKKMGACIALLLSSDQSNLKSIDLSANSLGSVGLSIVSRALKRNVRLESLNLAENEIDADFEPSAGGGYDIFMRAMNHLRLALQWNRTLARLDLSFNSISEDGAKQVSVRVFG